MDEKQVLLNSYLSYAKIKGKTRGKSGGAILYTVNDEQSDGEVIGVFGNITSRKVGDKMTSFVKGVLSHLNSLNEDIMTQIDSEPSTANGRVKLDFFAIRSSNNKIVGILVELQGIDLIYEIKSAVDEYLQFKHVDFEESDVTSSAKIMKTIDNKQSVSEHMVKIIHSTIQAFPVSVERMTSDEKKLIIQELEMQEVFYVKDSVKTVAELLEISVPTVYRLLKQ